MNSTNLLTALLAAAAGLGAAPQDSRTNWIEVAMSVGGSGTSSDGAYRRLVPSEGWGEEQTPPAWLEFTRGSGRCVLRGTLPVLREAAPGAVEVLRAELPSGARIEVRHTFGETSPRKHLRLRAEGGSVALAHSVRRAFDRIEPGALATVRGTGVVREDRFEGESAWAIVTATGERVTVESLPEALGHDGTQVKFEARRRGGRPDLFSYFGGVGQWRSVARLTSAERIEPASTRPAIETKDLSAWLRECEQHARTLFAGERLARAPVVLLASGFDEMTDPGFGVCPTCHRALLKDWVFAGSGLDEVEATLGLCPRDAFYFLARDGDERGPLFPGFRRSRRP